ncbi:hypothetical protein A1O7_00185 [Cladophialophora yegresii CBS 114405]|uniref:Uncharacterized protein n=1 Tax=Cladophialophora yegresii CBS 114405 TaxID=1182544 RepID=W9WFU5_9EURO|nr:uncharacterized protein A1O7_00185 [Cladophialophora yegresii CBS 114405]EXJ63850.1 hypothetical protein A1O7_00185 [Cladophialophora yegresii CBS 114405]
MTSSGGQLQSIPDQNLLSLLFSNKDRDDDSVAWRDGKNRNQTITKGQTRKLVCQLTHRYRQSGLIESGKWDPDKVINLTENQVMGFPNVLALIALGAVVATCP